MSEDLFLFEQLCQSGGIVNAYQALVEAERIAKWICENKDDET